jgi:hypothetical protein
MAGNWTELINSISPTDRWVVRVQEPMGWAIFKAGNIHGTWRLDILAGAGIGHVQQLEEQYNRLIPQSDPSRVQYNPEPREHITNCEQIGQRTYQDHDGITGTSNHSNQSDYREGRKT